MSARVKRGTVALGGAAALCIAAAGPATAATQDTASQGAKAWQALPSAERSAVATSARSYGVQLNASGGAAGDQFGQSVAVLGNTVVVGAPGATINQKSGQGAAYVFTVSGSNGSSKVTQVAELTAPDGAAGDGFGTSVAASGDEVVVGSPYADNYQGAVYQFTSGRNGYTNGTRPAELTASDGASGDTLGTSVAINTSDVIVAGAPQANASQGAVYEFARLSHSETQSAKLTASDGAAGDILGYAVAISAHTIVAGAPFATVGSNFQQGAAYIFAIPAPGVNTGVQTAKLTASDGVSQDEFGLSVSTDDRTIAVGAPQATVAGNPGAGSVYAFAKPPAGWTSGPQTAKLTSSSPNGAESLGQSVSVSGSLIVGGAPATTVGSNMYQGAVYAFVAGSHGYTTGTQAYKATVPNGQSNDAFGQSVAISGNDGVAGAPGVANNRGAAYFVRAS